MRGIQYSRRSRRGHGAAIALLPLRDFVLASISLAIALPLMIVVAAAIKCDSPGPALVRRARIARDGRHFQLLEFRTTLHDPEKTAATWDQQRTRVGLALYHTRIDALPQLINVLRGDMPLSDMEVCSLF